MKARWYAEALFGALKGKNEREAEHIVARLYEVVRTHGHTGILRDIPEELDKVLARDRARREVVLVTADEKSRAKWAHAYDHYAREGVISQGSEQRVAVDTAIVGGFQIRNRRMLIDGSYKKFLNELYQNIVNKKH